MRTATALIALSATGALAAAEPRPMLMNQAMLSKAADFEHEAKPRVQMPAGSLGRTLHMSEARQIQQKAFYRSSKYNDVKQQEFGRRLLDHENRGNGMLESKYLLPAADKMADASRRRGAAKLQELQHPTTLKGKARKQLDDARTRFIGKGGGAGPPQRPGAESTAQSKGGPQKKSEDAQLQSGTDSTEPLKHDHKLRMPAGTGAAAAA